MSQGGIYRNQLQKLFFDDLRPLLISLLTPSTRYAEYNVNTHAADNFKKYPYPDFLKIKDRRQEKTKRYLTVDACLTILEKNGYKLDLVISLPE